MDSGKVILSFAILAICAVAARPQEEVYAPNPSEDVSDQEPIGTQTQYQYTVDPSQPELPPQSSPTQYDQQRQQRELIPPRSKRFIPYGAYSTVHSYSYLTPYPNAIKSVYYAPLVHAVPAYHAHAVAAYHAPLHPIYY